MFNSLLKEYFISVFSRKLKLRVDIREIKLDLWNGKCEFYDATIFHPPATIDPRWRSEIMAYAKKITCTFDPLISLFAYFTSIKKFAVFDTITVNRIDLFVEGYESEGQKTVLNLKLIGGEQKNLQRLRKPTYIEIKNQERLERRRKRQQLAQARAEAAAKSIRARSGSLTGGHKSHQLIDGSGHGQGHGSHGLDESGSGRSVQPSTIVEQSHHPVISQPQMVRSIPPENNHHTNPPKVQNTATTNFSSWISSANVLKNNIASKLNELREEVKDQGLIETMKSKTAQAIAATKVTVDAVYQKAKKKLGDSFQTRIAMLHERLRGGEPIEFPHEFQMQANSITFTEINVSLYHAFPPSLRQFEKRGLYVPQVSIQNVNGRLKFQSTNSSSQMSSKTTSEGSPGGILQKPDEMDVTTRSKLVPPSHLNKSDENESKMSALSGRLEVNHHHVHNIHHPHSHSHHHHHHHHPLLPHPDNNPKKLDHSVPNNESDGQNGKSEPEKRRKSLKEEMFGISQEKQSSRLLPPAHQLDEVESISPPKHENFGSDDNSDLKPSAVSVWTEVSSVSSESDLEGSKHNSNDYTYDNNQHNHHDTFLPNNDIPTWRCWLLNRLINEQQLLSERPLPELTSKTTEESLTGQNIEGEEMKTSDDHSISSSQRSSEHENENENENEDFTQASNILIQGNSLVFTSSDIDEYLRVSCASHFQLFQRSMSDLMVWCENYFKKFIATVQEFSGIPTCVVVYHLERILLYEILKDNTGRLLQDAWNDLGSSFKNVDDDDDDDETMESSVHLSSSSSSSSSHIHPEIPLFPIEM